MTQLDNTPRSTRDYARLYFTGVAMGIADLIPGVSGGTMAFILGVYSDLLTAIKAFNADLVRLLLRFEWREALARIPLLFLIPLGLGIGSAILLLARVMRFLLENQREFVFAFFFGLILASVLAIGWHLKRTTTTAVGLVGGTLFALLVTNLPLLQSPSHDPLTLLLSGMVAISAMLLPGISGSFILLVLGQYDYVLNAVSDLDLSAIIPVGIGAVIGLVLFARVISWTLKRYHDVTIAALVGFMLGSLHVIWPWKEVTATRLDRHGEEVPAAYANLLPDVSTGAFWLAVALMVGGFLLVNAMDHAQSRNNPLFSRFDKGSAKHAPASAD